MRLHWITGFSIAVSALFSGCQSQSTASNSDIQPAEGAPVNASKCDALKSRLKSATGSPLVSVKDFFDGNTDLGSIGCNLIKHPGIEKFRDTLAAIAARPDVEGIYISISEIDPGDGSWPFSDTVYFVGPVTAEVLAEQLAGLQPDEVGIPPGESVPEEIRKQRKGPVLMAWWD